MTFCRPLINQSACGIYLSHLINIITVSMRSHWTLYEKLDCLRYLWFNMLCLLSLKFPFQFSTSVFNFLPRFWVQQSCSKYSSWSLLSKVKCAEIATEERRKITGRRSFKFDKRWLKRIVTFGNTGLETVVYLTISICACPHAKSNFVKFLHVW